MKNQKRLSTGKGLRRKALARMDQNTRAQADHGATASPDQGLLFELQVRQIELEIQNEELRSVQEDLDTALRQYTDLFELAPVGYYTLNKQSRIEEVNLMGASLLNQPRTHLIDASFTAFVQPGHRPQFSTFLKCTWETDAKQTCELQLAKDGGGVWVHIEGSRSMDGGARRVLLGVIDISDRKRMEEQFRMEAEVRALEEARRNKKLILDNIPDRAWLKDIDGRYVMVNEAFAMVCGWKVEMVTAKTDFDIFPRDMAEKWHALEEEVLRSGRRKYQEEAIVDHEGCMTWFETVRTPIFDEQGTIIGIVGIARDVSIQKRAEEQLRVSRDELRSLTLQLNLAEEKERRYLAMELHDNVSQNLAYCKIKLKELELDNESRSRRRLLLELGNVIGKTIQDVRTLTFELSPPILYELGLEPAIDWLGEHVLLRRGIRYQVEHADQMPPMSQELQIILFQIVRELLNNTVKHAQATTVRVVLRATEQNITVSVQDDGIGFNVPELIRCKPASLGMFSIRERLRHLGGFLSLHSQPGCGTTAKFEVPIF